MPTNTSYAPAVVADIATPEARDQNQLADLRGMSPQQIQAHAVDVCRRVAALIDQKTPGAEAEGFKRPGMDAPRRPALYIKLAGGGLQSAPRLCLVLSRMENATSRGYARNRETTPDSPDNSAVASNTLASNIGTIADFEQRALLQRSTAERIADRITRFTGSASFALLHLAWFSGWIVANAGLVSGIAVFDPFPFSFLTLVVSLEAIFLSLFILMNQNRMTGHAERRAHVNLQIDLLTEKEATMTLQLLERICLVQTVVDHLDGRLPRE